MDLVFDCPKCGVSLEVDASGAGEEIPCPSCSQRILIPEPGSPPAGAAGAQVDGAQVSTLPQPMNAIAASAAAKVEKHLRVPVHNKPPEKLIAKPPVPLEVAAKTSDRQLRVKCIRHIDCVEVGHDKFDEMVTDFLGRIGEQNLVSVTPISYSFNDIASQKQLTDFGVMIIYKG
jgi:DNA-directed RNA polymerase subunit RPC12/RpoP